MKIVLLKIPTYLKTLSQKKSITLALLKKLTTSQTKHI